MKCKFKPIALSSEGKVSEEKVNEHLSTLPMALDVDSLWEQCSEVVQISATEVIGLQKPQRAPGKDKFYR